MKSLVEQVQQALQEAGSVVLAPSRRAAAAAIATVRLAGRVAVVDPHGEIEDPYQPLTWERLRGVVRAAPEGAIIDATPARPWDDPVWWALLDRLPHSGVLVLPARFGPRIGRPAPYVELPPDRLEAALELVREAPDTPDDDDGPLLRRLVLEARGGDDERERLVRLLRLGQYELAWGAAVRAVTVLEEAAAVARERVAQDASEAQRYHELAAVCDALGDGLARLDRVDEAAAAFAESRDASERCRVLWAGAEPSWGAAVSALRVGQAALAEGRYGEGEAEVEGATASLALDGLAPERRAAVLGRLGDVRGMRGRLDDAEEAWQAAARALRDALETSPRRFDLRAELADLLVRRAGVAVGRDDRETAARCLEAASPALEAVMARAPSHRGWRAGLAAAAVAWADLHLAEGRRRAAERALSQAAEAYEGLLALDPDRADLRAELSRVWRRRVYTADAPLPWHERDLEATRRLVAARPSDPARQHDLAQAEMAGAWLALRDGRPSAKAWDRAIAAAEAAGDALPAFRRTLIRCRDTRTLLPC